MMAKFVTEIEIAMRAKVGIIWLVSREEIRIERTIVPVADKLGYKVQVWTVTKGLTEVDSTEGDDETRQIDAALNRFVNSDGRSVLIIKDGGSWLKDALAIRTAKDTHQQLQKLPKDNAKQIIVVDEKGPGEGLGWATIIECALPDREEMTGIIDSFMEWAPEAAKADVNSNGNKETIISAMLGLTVEEASNALSRSLASCGIFDPTKIAAEKSRVVKGSGIEWYEPVAGGIQAIGGLETLKRWLVQRKKAFGKEARAYGLPSPKGALLVGVPGCGKSLTAKAIATAWGLPLLRMDVGALFSKYVGESEGMIRKALQTAETIAPCILWVDEVEKAFGSGGGESDGGTSGRVFGTFLTWMQERKAGVFVIATSNDISKLPSEFLRAGRWDELWFVDLPTVTEREEICKVMSAKYAACVGVSGEEVAKLSEGYTGAEIEQAFVDGMYRSFADGRQVRTADVREALSVRVPLAITAKEKISALKEWAKKRARNASASAEVNAVASGRVIE